MMMPELDGYGVLHQLKQNSATKTIPFIFFTAKATKMNLPQGIELRADDYIIKPFRARELLATVRNHLGKKAAPNCNF